MKDPFLEAHRVGRFRYAATGFSPLSLRDQILRGATLVRRLAARGEIGAGKRLLVAGAGAAGVSAALAASRLGIPTLLLDEGNHPFALQRRAATRHIDPAAYDWPVDHWSTGRLRCGLDSLPMPFAADYAPILAAAWTELLNVAVSDPTGRLTWCRQAKVGRCGDEATGASAALSDGTTHRGAVLILATGDKRERTKLPTTRGAPNFVGPEFWAPDSLTELGGGDHVLVSGAGDGALQDALRALTGEDKLSYLLRALRLPRGVAAIVQSAEDRAHRIRVWLPQRTGDAAEERACLEELDARHRDAVRRALAAPSLADRVLELAGPERPTVHLVHRNAWLSSYYGINRFLALLFDTALRDSKRAPLLYPGCEVAAATQTKPHRVTFRGRQPPQVQHYQHVIVRHGYDDTSAGAGVTLPPIRSHLLPYHIP